MMTMSLRAVLEKVAVVVFSGLGGPHPVDPIATVNSRNCLALMGSKG
jgi:hypothetical protein